MISVAICTYNRCQVLETTLRSLAELIVPPGLRWEILIIDNNSQDATRQVAAAFAERTEVPVRYVFETLQGIGYARNRAIQEAIGEWLVFTDDDVQLDPQWLAEFSSALKTTNCIAAGGKVVAVWPNDTIPEWFVQRGRFATPGGAIPEFDLGQQRCEATKAPLTANAAFRRIAFEKYGGFRTDLGQMPIGEDTELFDRLVAAGEKILYVPDAVVMHPVYPQRATKSYIERWCFQAGKAHVRLKPAPLNTIHYLGVPRYFFKQLAVNVLKYIVSLDSRQRFYHRLHVCLTAGMITGSCELARGAGVKER